MIRIYADFNEEDEDGNVLLDCVGSLRDLEAQRAALKPGDTVVLYMTDEFEVEATLKFDRVWIGVPDWKTIKYTPPRADAGGEQPPSR